MSCSKVWKESLGTTKNNEDLVSVDVEQDLDVFTRWVADKFVPWLHRIALHRGKVNDERLFCV
jgi:hypothetical protein